MTKASGSQVLLIGVQWRVRGDQVVVVRKHGPRCESCRWWSEPGCSDCSEDNPGLRACSAPFTDHISHDGELLTPPNFGCVQWEGIDED